jgi:hypothetical protein
MLRVPSGETPPGICVSLPIAFVQSCLKKSRPRRRPHIYAANWYRRPSRSRAAHIPGAHTRGHSTLASVGHVHAGRIGLLTWWPCASSSECRTAFVVCPWRGRPLKAFFNGSRSRTPREPSQTCRLWPRPQGSPFPFKTTSPQKGSELFVLLNGGSAWPGNGRPFRSSNRLRAGMVGRKTTPEDSTRGTICPLDPRREIVYTILCRRRRSASILEN